MNPLSFREIIRTVGLAAILFRVHFTVESSAPLRLLIAQTWQFLYSSKTTIIDNEDEKVAFFV